MTASFWWSRSKGNLHAHLTGIAGQLLAYTRHIGERVHTLEGGAAVDQLARDRYEVESAHVNISAPL